MVKNQEDMSTIQELLSQNLKAIRKEKGLSQQNISDRSGILASTYSRIETKKVSPTIDTVERIAVALEVSFAELFQSIEIADKSMLQKIQLINSLSEYNRNVAEVLLDTIIEKDKLEKTQEVKMKSRLNELENARKKWDLMEPNG